MLVHQLNGGQPPEAILFDLDGTLIDSAPDLVVAVNQMLIGLSLREATTKQTQTWIGNGGAKLVERALRFGLGKTETDAEVEALQGRAMDLFFDRYQDCCCETSQLYPGVLDTLGQLQQQGVKMACVTNKPSRFTLPMLAHYQLEALLPVAISGDTCAVKKPEAEPLLLACRELGCPAEHSIMVGDSINDVQAARNAGMPVVAVDYGYNHGVPIEESAPDAVISDFADLLR